MKDKTNKKWQTEKESSEQHALKNCAVRIIKDIEATLNLLNITKNPEFGDMMLNILGFCIAKTAVQTSEPLKALDYAITCAKLNMRKETVN